MHFKLSTIPSCNYELMLADIFDRDTVFPRKKVLIFTNRFLRKRCTSRGDEEEEEEEEEARGFQVERGHDLNSRG